MKKILDIINPKVFTNKSNGQRIFNLPRKKMKSELKVKRIVVWGD